MWDLHGSTHIYSIFIRQRHQGILAQLAARCAKHWLVQTIVKAVQRAVGLGDFSLPKLIVLQIMAFFFFFFLCSSYICRPYVHFYFQHHVHFVSFISFIHGILSKCLLPKADENLIYRRPATCRWCVQHGWSTCGNWNFLCFECEICINLQNISSAEHFFSLSWMRRSRLNSGPFETMLGTICCTWQVSQQCKLGSICLLRVRKLELHNWTGSAGRSGQGVALGHVC